MSRLTELIAHIKNKDPQIGVELEREFKEHSSRLAFGLNFERHRPEVVELPKRIVRRGDKVRKLSLRGKRTKKDPRIWIVKKISTVKKTKSALIEIVENNEVVQEEVLVDDLSVIAEFRDYLYPGLVSTGKVKRGGDKPFHTVINGENSHVLKGLTYSHRGKVDVIYIDPPYNSGARDWKYNNDYVEREDIYRHSKWLAFIERRLLIAKELLNPSNSMLIVTIDEKEYLRLGLLLEQLFPGQRVQMISSVINPKGSARGKEFYRVDEYIFYVFFGSAIIQDVNVPGLCISKSDSNSKEADDDDDAVKKAPSVRWASLLRSGSGAQRENSQLKFFPVLVDLKTSQIVGAGEPIPLGQSRESYKPPKGLTPVWPIRSDETEGRWQLNLESFRKLLEDKHIKIGKINKKTGKITFYYLMEGQREKLENGKLVITGEDELGGIIVEYANMDAVGGRPKTQWSSKSHSATDHGTSLLRKLLPGRSFPFPKSVYAVEDTLRFFVSDKPDAIILDFFAGSGTTAHAVMRLNKQDSGRRQSISITNNEVSADEQSGLKKKKLRPGDKEWEELGICNYITKPRVETVISGITYAGKKVEGNYSFTDKFSISDGFEENAEFFDLTYETSISVSHNLAFSKIAPLLWMRAGSQGDRVNNIPKLGYKVVETYGILVDLDKATEFCKEIRKKKSIRVAYIVTNDDRRFQIIYKRLPESVEPVRLYESYLKNFEITSGE
jgi:adenine-specific DNA-methyltransferase